MLGLHSCPCGSSRAAGAVGSVVVGPGGRVVVRGDPAGVEQCVLQAFVAGAGGELTADRGAGSSCDRRGPVADVQEDLGGGLDADPRHAHQDRGEREVLQYALDLPSPVARCSFSSLT